MSGTASVAALIINWSGAGDTLELIRSLIDCQGPDISVTAVVIDNGSPAHDRAQLLQGLSTLQNSIKVIWRANNSNMGIPAAYNQAIQIAGLDFAYYLRLDNDVVLMPSSIRAMISAMRERAGDGVGIVGGNIRYYHSRERSNCGAVSIDLVRGRTTILYPGCDTVCDGVLGCVMLLSGELVRSYSPEVFDSRLFLLTDESELSLRAARDGVRTLYVAQYIAYHKGGCSTRRVPHLCEYYSCRNWTFLRLKYTRGVGTKVCLLAHLAADLLRLIGRGRWKGLLGVLSGLLWWASGCIDTHVRRSA